MDSHLIDVMSIQNMSHSSHSCEYVNVDKLGTSIIAVVLFEKQQESSKITETKHSFCNVKSYFIWFSYFSPVSCHAAM